MAKKQTKKKAPVKKKAPKKTTAIEIVKRAPIEVAALTDQSLSLANPQQIMAFSGVLKKYIKENKLSVMIQGNDYAMVDGWKFAGANFGLTSIPEEPIAQHIKGQYLSVLFHEVEFSKKEKDGKVSKYIKEVPLFVGMAEDREAVERAARDKKITRELTKPYFAYGCKSQLIQITTGRLVGAGYSICTNLEFRKIEFDEYSVQSMSQTRSIGKGYRNTIGYIMKAAGIEGTPAEEMDFDDEEVKPGKSTKSKRNEPVKSKMSEGQKTNVLTRIKAGEDLMEQTIEAFDISEDADFMDAMKTFTSQYVNK